jgi:hypothetical protein
MAEVRFDTRARGSMPAKHKTIHRESGDKSQVRAFRKAARELGCDESEDRFKEALQRIAKQKPRPQKGKVSMR